MVSVVFSSLPAGRARGRGGAILAFPARSGAAGCRKMTVPGRTRLATPECRVFLHPAMEKTARTG